MIIDIIVVAILAIFLLIGLFKGFLRTLLSLFGNLASLAVAIMVAKPVAKLIGGWGLNNFFQGKISSGLSSFIPEIATGDVLTGTQVSQALSDNGMSKILQTLINPFLNAEYASTQEILIDISTSLGGIATLICSVIILFILIRLAVLILSKIFDALTKGAAINGLDRLLGAIMGILKGAVAVGSILSIFFFLNSIPLIAEWFDPIVQGSTITLKLYNLIQDGFNWLLTKINLPSLINGILGSITGGSGGSGAIIGLLK